MLNTISTKAILSSLGINYVNENYSKGVLISEQKLNDFVRGIKKLLHNGYGLEEVKDVTEEDYTNTINGIIKYTSTHDSLIPCLYEPMEV